MDVCEYFFYPEKKMDWACVLSQRWVPWFVYKHSKTSERLRPITLGNPLGRLRGRIVLVKRNHRHLHNKFTPHCFLSCLGFSLTPYNVHTASNVSWESHNSFLHFSVCSLSVGSVYLLRRVEASETMGDAGWGHLEQPPVLQAWEPAGSVALLLLHVCPRWVRHCHYMTRARVRVKSGKSLVKLIIFRGVDTSLL